MTTNDALRELGLTYPFSSTELKSAYRRAVRLAHPDMGGTGAHFQRAQDAFEALKPAATGAGSRLESAAKTIEGMLLSELGLGLGPLKNGRPCQDCKGNGYTSYRDFGLKRVPCPACKGQGCRRCWFSGVVQMEISAGQIHHACMRCKGTGEIEMFNPLLPKGRITPGNR